MAPKKFREVVERGDWRVEVGESMKELVAERRKRSRSASASLEASIIGCRECESDKRNDEG